MTLREEKQRFVDLCVQEGMAELDARALLLHASALQHLCVEDCNRNLTEQEKSMLAIAEKRIARIVAKYSHLGFEVDTNGDPRGAVVKLRIPNYHGNDFGGTGMECVPC